MFYKKYVFESKRTRSARFLNSLLAITIISTSVITLLCIYIPQFAQDQNEIAGQAFFKRTPDVIAVFTGDSGRIDYTFKKAEKYPSAKVFITGVYSKNTLKTLLHRQGKNLSVEEFLDQESHHIELDYLARNTIENGLATLHFVNKTSEVKEKNILIISSDYHILRVSMIMDTLNDNPNNHFYYESISSDYRKISNIKKLLKEVYKTLKASAFLSLWDRDGIHKARTTDK